MRPSNGAIRNASTAFLIPSWGSSMCFSYRSARTRRGCAWRRFSISPEPEDSIMADPFLSEIRLMSFVFAPKDWALCNGQLLPISQNQALFALLGTTFGGDGRVNFALPDLRARTPIHVGGGHTLGERGGEQAHTLSIAELPTHTHVLNGSNTPAEINTPDNSYLATVNNA